MGCMSQIDAQISQREIFPRWLITAVLRAASKQGDDKKQQFCSVCGGRYEIRKFIKVQKKTSTKIVTRDTTQNTVGRLVADTRGPTGGREMGKDERALRELSPLVSRSWSPVTSHLTQSAT